MYLQLWDLVMSDSPLCWSFQKNHKVIGFDLDSYRISSLVDGIDLSGEEDLQEKDVSTNISFTSKVEDISVADVYIVAVPTPITSEQLPDVGHLEQACKMIAPLLKEGNGVIFEINCLPGCD